MQRKENVPNVQGQSGIHKWKEEICIFSRISVFLQLGAKKSSYPKKNFATGHTAISLSQNWALFVIETKLRVLRFLTHICFLLKVGGRGGKERSKNPDPPFPPLIGTYHRFPAKGIPPTPPPPQPHQRSHPTTAEASLRHMMPNQRQDLQKNLAHFLNTKIASNSFSRMAYRTWAT